jgi:hypothetical protein
LLAGSVKEYLVFRGVTNDVIADIYRYRACIGSHTRLTHYENINLLIVKIQWWDIPRTLHRVLANGIEDALTGMSLPPHSLVHANRMTFHGPNSWKEGDSAYKPICRNKDTDWPTIVLEYGSLACLRHDTHWWLTTSRGEVEIVLFISIISERKTLRIEKWCLSPPAPHRPATRAHPNAQSLVPTRMQQITIVKNPAASPNPATYAVTGAPLILEFEKLLLRAPVPPEGDVIITATHLSEFADYCWRSYV